MEEQLDSLEDWVAVKHNPFSEGHLPPKIIFIIGWNEVEKKIAVTSRQHNRVASDLAESGNRTGLFTFSEIRAVHELLCLVHGCLAPYLPDIPVEPRGLWTFISPMQTPDDIDEICKNLERYFQIVLEICNERLLISTLFEEFTADDYFENFSEIHRRSYEEAVAVAEEQLENVLFLRESSVTMSEKEDMYNLEDAAMAKLNINLASFYNFQIQPFLDMRELAFTKLREARKKLQDIDTGERIKAEYRKIFTEWQGHYERALDNIQELYIKYYKTTCNNLQAMLERMKQDKEKFGKTAFDLLGVDRMRRQLIVIASVKEYPEAKAELEKLEEKVFNWTLKIHDVCVKILDEEEILAKTQIDGILKQVQDEEESGVFYDAFEDAESLKEYDEPMTTTTASNPHLQHLKSQINRIQQKKASFRNKKKRQQHKEKVDSKQEFIQEERRKAIKRLQDYKLKYPTPSTIRPPTQQQQKAPLSASDNNNKEGTKKVFIKKQTALKDLNGHSADSTRAPSVIPNLESILSSKKRLKPASRHIKPPPIKQDPMDDILDMIKKGVKLRPTTERDSGCERGSPSPIPSDSHLKLLQESLNRINRLTRDSSPESDDSDYDNFDDY
eukprot:XP_014777382.1 PREDICTED: junction-mediating and -regulatory protein-like [Octopus bimaculoides]